MVFHYIVLKERGFGVWKLMSEIKIKFPYFEFMHGVGLGLLCTGENIDPGFLAFVKLFVDDGFSALW